MKLLYIFLLSFVVGSRRLSGYYNKICSIMYNKLASG